MKFDPYSCLKRKLLLELQSTLQRFFHCCNVNTLLYVWAEFAEVQQSPLPNSYITFIALVT